MPSNTAQRQNYSTRYSSPDEHAKLQHLCLMAANLLSFNNGDVPLLTMAIPIGFNGDVLLLGLLEFFYVKLLSKQTLFLLVTTALFRSPPFLCSLLGVFNLGLPTAVDHPGHLAFVRADALLRVC